MEIIQPLWGIGKCLWRPLKCRINYIRKFQKNFEKLNQDAQYLFAKKADVDIEIESDKDLKVPTNECKTWLKDVGEIENEVNAIGIEFKENKKCLGEWCPNFWWRMKLGKRIKTMSEKITRLNEKTKFERGMVVLAPPRIVDPTPTQMIEIETSTDRTVQKILRYFRDEKIGKIGVWGMGGVGKTTILKSLNNSPDIFQMFQIVIWVTVSKEWCVRKVQKDITDRLSLKLGENETVDGISRKLFQKLGAMKYLLILDDLWDRLDLEVVGVPHPTKENGCKIILATRFLDVCRRMETEMDIKVEVLPEKEAWDLFHKKVGDVVDSSTIKPLAIEVVNECGGLPLLLVVIGRSLRNVNDVHVWSNAITELRRSTFQIDDDMEKLVFKQLKFSYDRLMDDNLKNCFLYCALYPEDYKIPIRELIEHWWVEGFIDGKLNISEAYDKGHALLSGLTNASLLERIEHYRHRLVNVKMHDVIRDLALRITSCQGEGICRFMVKAGFRRRAHPNEEEWEQAERMSLMHCDLNFLPERPKCAFLTTLLLQYSSNLREISNSFFEHMPNLRVLNLLGTGIKELPWSLLNLANLRGLYLLSSDRWHTGTWLDTLPSGIGNLTRLEVLHVGPWIKYLPTEVGQLTRLKSLRVVFNNEVSLTPPSHIIPQGLLSRLTLLEDLQMLMNEETLKLWVTTYTEAVVEELVSLKQLVSLAFHFPEVEYLESFLQRSSNWNERCFNTFGFFVRCKYDYVRGDRYLGLGFSEHDSIFSPVIRKALTRASGFILYNNGSCKKLSDLCNMEMMNGLECCHVSRCDAIETLIDGNGLPNLERLKIEFLPELRSIWEGLVLPQSVTYLKYLRIVNCRKLSKIFSPGMILYLSNLEVLEVRNCGELEEIVNEEDMAMVVNNEEDVVVVLFSRLKNLILIDLPKLVRICKRVPNPIGWPSLFQINICVCPNLKNFPLKSSRAPALTSASAEAVKLEYEDEATKQEVCRLP